MKKTIDRLCTGLLVCMLAVTAFASQGCTDESEEYSVPPTLKVHYSYTENELGTFLYSEKEKSWVIISDSVILLPNDTLPERPIIYEIEDNEVFVDDATRAEYNKLIGNTVIFSGKYEPLGNEILTNYAYLVGYGYTLRGFLPADVNISLANTRSAMENVIEAEVFAEENKPIKLEKKVKDKTPKEKKVKDKTPKEKKAKKKVWPLLLVLVVVAVIALIVAFALGLFEKKTIRVGDTFITVAVGEEYAISVLNYRDIGKPELTWTVVDDSIAEVEFNRGSATIIGLEEGTTDIVVSGSWCKDRTIHVTVEEASFELEGASFETIFYEYYFLENGTYYLISKTEMDHYVGEYSMEECDEDDVLDYASENDLSTMQDRVEDGQFFRVDLDGENYYYGQLYDGTGYQIMYICTNGEDTVIYDIFTCFVSEISDISMEDEADLEEMVYGTN